MERVLRLFADVRRGEAGTVRAYVLAAVTVFIGARLHLATVHFVALNIVLIGIWLLVVVALAGAHRVRAEAHP